MRPRSPLNSPHKPHNRCLKLGHTFAPPCSITAQGCIIFLSRSQMKNINRSIGIVRIIKGDSLQLTPFIAFKWFCFYTLLGLPCYIAWLHSGCASFLSFIMIHVSIQESWLFIAFNKLYSWTTILFHMNVLLLLRQKFIFKVLIP